MCCVVDEVENKEPPKNRTPKKKTCEISQSTQRAIEINSTRNQSATYRKCSRTNCIIRYYPNSTVN